MAIDPRAPKINYLSTKIQPKSTPKKHTTNNNYNKAHTMPGNYGKTHVGLRGSFGVRTRSGAKAFDSKKMLDAYVQLSSGSNKSSPSKSGYNLRRRN